MTATSAAEEGGRGSGPTAPADAPAVRRGAERGAIIVGTDDIARCAWAGDDAEYRRYHDDEWGRPLHGDRLLFEKICLEGFQAGLSWITILRRRPTLRLAFRDFEPEVVAAFTDDDIDRLMNDPGIIRNKAKVLATIKNARALLGMQAERGDGALDRLVWSHQPEPRAESDRPSRLADVPAVTEQSTSLSKALRSLGFGFVGPTTMYALMQSAGLVDDHVVGCHRVPGGPAPAA